MLPLASYTSASSREQRRASALREAVSAAAGVPSRPFGGPQDAPCYRDGRYGADGSSGWDVVGIGDSGPADVLARFEAGLAREGFQTTRGQAQDEDDRTTRHVLGTRGRASALVEQSAQALRTGGFVLHVEDGCSQVQAPR